MINTDSDWKAVKTGAVYEFKETDKEIKC